MGRVDLPMLAYQIIIFSFLSSFAINLVSAESYGYAKTLDRNLFGLSNKEEKLTHFRLYWHDIYSGSEPTAVRIVSAPNISLTAFGFVSMIDDPLTEGPELSSKLVGKAQGFYASAARDEFGLLMVMNFVFIEGKYNGSTISIVGRNKVLSDVREMPVIGGSGLFRFARGYVEARTQNLNMLTGDATVEYNIYVSHY